MMLSLRKTIVAGAVSSAIATLAPLSSASATCTPDPTTNTLSAVDCGAIADFSTDNTAAVNSALAAFTGSKGGTLVIDKGVYWDYSRVTHPFEVTIIDNSGYDSLNPGAHSTSQYKLYMKTASAGTKNANEFQIRADYHPAYILDNISGGANRNASVVWRQDGQFRWLVGKSWYTDDNFTISGRDSGNNMTARMVINDVTGEFGFDGTPVSGYAVAVNGTMYATGSVAAGNANAFVAKNAANDAYLYINNNGSTSQIWSTYGSSAEPKPLVLAVGATAIERMRIDTSGNVGIGTQSPVATLDINGTARLAKNGSAPYACDVTHDGALALTSKHTLCVCDGSAWVASSNGVRACSWKANSR